MYKDLCSAIDDVSLHFPVYQIDRSVQNTTHLRPGQTMVEIIFHLIIFRETQQIAVLHVHKILRLKNSIRKDEYYSACTAVKCIRTKLINKLIASFAIK